MKGYLLEAVSFVYHLCASPQAHRSRVRDSNRAGPDHPRTNHKGHPYERVPFTSGARGPPIDRGRKQEERARTPATRRAAVPYDAITQSMRSRVSPIVARTSLL